MLVTPELMQVLLLRKADWLQAVAAAVVDEVLRAWVLTLVRQARAWVPPTRPALPAQVPVRAQVLVQTWVPTHQHTPPC